MRDEIVKHMTGGGADVFPPLAEAFAGSRTVAILGCGSLLLGDDAAGMLVAERLAAGQGAGDGQGAADEAGGKSATDETAAAYLISAESGTAGGISPSETGVKSAAGEMPPETGAAAHGITFKAFRGGTAPENFTGEIKRFRPDVLLVVDAADMSLPPGAVALIPPEEVTGASFNTHMLPLNITLDYLRRETGCRVLLLGIQAKTAEFGAEMSPEVREAAEALAKKLERVMMAGSR